MSRFNTTIPKGKTKTVNFAGGEAYKQSKELELVSILLTSFVSDTFYRSSNDTLDRLKTLLSEVDPKFAAKAAIFARDKFGMRSITHALAGELTSHSTGLEWAKNFYDKVVVRPDDMMEIMGYYLSNKTDSKKPKFPNSLKKGFAKAFDRFDGYQIAKWKSDSKEVKLVDVVNLVHPVPTQKNKEALSSLISGDLKNTQTWESMLSQAGQQASNEEELGQLKADAWKDLIQSKKIGVMAALKNLRNIINTCPELTDSVCELITNENSIKKSRILPFRFKTAYDEIEKLNSKESRQVLSAISKALDLSVMNVPNLTGENLVVVDVSGSMSGKPSDIASLFAAIIAKSNNCDVMTFATKAQYVSFNPNDSVMTIRNSFKFTGGGTNLNDAFIKANKKYERIIILSDMQSFIGLHAPVRELNQYKIKYNANPYIYSWDLQGLGTMQFPENNVFALAGFSDKVFQIMSLLEQDRQSLVNEIRSIEI